MEAKAEIRRAMRQAKRLCPPQALAAKSAAVWRLVEALPEFRRARAVAAYWSLPDEVDTHAFIERWGGEKRIFLPAMCGQELELREYSPGCRLREADFCVWEPDGAAFSPDGMDLIIVPGVAFDGRGRRLGRGKGFYDRLLARTPAPKIGVCFDFQIVDQVPAQAHDIAMDFVFFS